jgi:hypothetical protein
MKKNRNHGRNQVQKTMTSQSKAILKIKHAHQSEHMIEASFKNSEGNGIKELIYTFRDGDLAELLFKLEKQLLNLGDRYDLFKTGWWKVLGQIGGRALEGRCEKSGTTLSKAPTTIMPATPMLSARDLKS